MMVRCRKHRENEINKSTSVLTEKLGRKPKRAVRQREEDSAPQDRSPRMLLPAVIFWSLSPEVLENARRAEHAAFFEDEGLQEFLQLEWDIEIQESVVRKFICNYDIKKHTVFMSTREICVDEELLVKVFRLPSGTYYTSKKHKAKIVAPSFPTDAGGDDGVGRTDCTDTVWEHRLRFLYQVFGDMSTNSHHIPNNFTEFLQVERKKRDWLDVLRTYIRAEIARIRRAGVGVITGSRIGRHISLIIAHLQNKKNMHSFGICTMRTGRKSEEPQISREAEEILCSSDDGGSNEKNENEEQQGEEEKTEDNKAEEENHQGDVGLEQTDRSYFTNDFKVGDQFLRLDQGIDQMLTSLGTNLRKEIHSFTNQVELRNSEYVEGLRHQISLLKEKNYCLEDQVQQCKSAFAAVQDKFETIEADNRKVSQLRIEIVEIRRENESLKEELEQSNSKWRIAKQDQEELEEKLKKEEEKLGEAEQARQMLESQAIAFFNNITKLGTITRMSTDASTSSGSQPCKKTKLVTKNEDK